MLTIDHVFGTNGGLEDHGIHLFIVLEDFQVQVRGTCSLGFAYKGAWKKLTLRNMVMFHDQQVTQTSSSNQNDGSPANPMFSKSTVQTHTNPTEEHFASWRKNCSFLSVSVNHFSSQWIAASRYEWSDFTTIKGQK